MKAFMEKHPFWFALGFTVIVLQLLGLIVVVVGARVLGFPMLPMRVMAALVTTIVPLVYIWRVGWWQDVGFVSTTQNVYALTLPLVLIFFPMVFFGSAGTPTQELNIFLVAVFLTGLSEEAIFRDLFIRAFLPQGKWRAVLLSSLLFGGAHIVQSFGVGMTMQDNVVQMANAFLGGILMTSVRLRVNNLWPLIIIHTLEDYFWIIAGFTTGVHDLSEISLSLYVIKWALEIITAVYLMRQPATATIDGQPVG
ncbi:MAG: CPBP family intramembrane glutamic endopeptidase [Caldilineaceae bacterium]